MSEDLWVCICVCLFIVKTRICKCTFHCQSVDIFSKWSHFGWSSQPQRIVWGSRLQIREQGLKFLKILTRHVSICVCVCERPMKDKTDQITYLNSYFSAHLCGRRLWNDTPNMGSVSTLKIRLDVWVRCLFAKMMIRLSEIIFTH